MRHPLEAGTLAEMLVRRTDASPSRVAFRWRGADHTYRWVLDAARAFADRAWSEGVRPGDPVVVALPNGPDFVFTFHGLLSVGAVPVPVYPGPDPARWATLARLSGACHLVLPANLESDIVSAARRSGELAGIRCVAATTEPVGSVGSSAGRSDPEPSSRALIQFTSGSTADPKGVQLTHAAVMTNVRQMVEGMEISERDSFVSWLPVHHDMGLVLKVLVPCAVGAPLELLPTSLRHPGRWLDAIAERRATFTAGPDSAYRLTLRGRRDRDGPDLSSLRVALNAAEPVRASTIEAFERQFGLRNVMVAGYGLAEATVGVSMMPPGSPVRRDSSGHVSVGRPFPGITVTVASGGGGAPGRRPGELRVRTPAATLGYVGNAPATRALFDQGGALRTGDLGTVDDEGFVFVRGRSKDVIIQAGQSLHAADVEELAEEAPWARRAAAVGLEPRPGVGEQLYLFVETRAHGLDDGLARARVADLTSRIHRRFGLRPGRVYLVRPKAIPLTPNGKKRRHELGELHLGRTLFREGLVLYPRY
jgi:acyl-CoA synthetase (AMP-forming)/AMP-acid ligase II